MGFSSAALEKNNLLTLGICSFKDKNCRHDDVTFVWRGQLIFIKKKCCLLHSVAFLPPLPFSPSLLILLDCPLLHLFLFTTSSSNSLTTLSCTQSSFVKHPSISRYPLFLHLHPLLIFSSLLFSLSLPLFCFCWCLSLSLSARPCHFSMREQALGRRRLREVTSQRAGPLCSFIRNFQRVSISPSRLQYELFPRYIQHSGATQPVFTCIFILQLYFALGFRVIWSVIGGRNFHCNWQENE